jgi:hypothetical protein
MPMVDSRGKLEPWREPSDYIHLRFPIEVVERAGQRSSRTASTSPCRANHQHHPACDPERRTAEQARQRSSRTASRITLLRKCASTTRLATLKGGLPNGPASEVREPHQHHPAGQIISTTLAATVES